jgi:hypothetical protein
MHPLPDGGSDGAGNEIISKKRVLLRSSFAKPQNLENRS